MKKRINTATGPRPPHEGDRERRGERTRQADDAAKQNRLTGMDGYASLTGRERSIVSELIRHKGAPNKVIAYALQISPNTLRNHLASIYGKLGVRRRVELIIYALERGLDALPEGEGRRSTSARR